MAISLLEDTDFGRRRVRYLKSPNARSPGGDPFFPNVAFLLSGNLDSTPIGSNSIVTDKNGFTLNGIGTATLEIQSRPSGGGVDNALRHVPVDASLGYWEGSVSMPAVNLQDFTLEFFYQLTSDAIVSNIFAFQSAGSQDLIAVRRENASANVSNFRLYLEGMEVAFISSVATPKNIGHHVCLQRVGNDFAFYFGGNRELTDTNATSISTSIAKIRLLPFSDPIFVGRELTMGQIRFTLGVARYADEGANTATIPVPTLPFPAG